MSKAIGGLLRELAGSKKFAAKVIGLVVVLLLYVGLDKEIAEPVAQLVTVIVVAYLGGQGLADHGKEKAKVESDREPRVVQ
jgi:hypothetical protein